MEPIYIISIAVGGLIFLLFIICLCVIAKMRKRAEELRAELETVYSDPDLSKMDYDIALYDDETSAKIAAMRVKDDTQVTIDDVMADSDKSAKSRAADEAIFSKIDDGVEEISGHYEPED